MSAQSLHVQPLITKFMSHRPSRTHRRGKYNFGFSVLVITAGKQKFLRKEWEWEQILLLLASQEFI